MQQKLKAVAPFAAVVLAALGLVAGPASAEAPPLPVAKSQSGNYLAALIAGADRDTAAAAAYFREALKGDPLNADLMGRAFASSLGSGEIDKAALLADKFVLRDPHNSLVRLALAARAFSQGQYGQARAHLAAGTAGRAHDVTSTMLTAWAYAGVRDERHALESLDQITDKALGVFKDFHAGLIADALGDAKEADKRLRSAYLGDKATLRFVDAYARALSRHGDLEGAKAVYAEYDKATPKHPLVEAALADLAAGRKLEPIVRDAREGAAEALYGLGGAGRGQGDELASLIYLRLSLYLRPDHDLAAATIADLFEQNKQTADEIVAYQMVPEKSPMRESAQIQAATAMDSVGRNAEGLALMQKLVDARPKDVDAIVALADLQRSAKKFGEAAANYDLALALIGEPSRVNWPLFYFRAICRERLKQWPSAEADFKKALSLFPDQPLVLNYLGYSWIDQGINLDEAFGMLRKAVSLKPDDGYIVDSLGWAHFKLAHFGDALGIMEKAVELKPADPTVNDHLGDVYWRVGRRTEAVFQWNHARDMKPEPEDLPAILKKIADGLPELAAKATEPAAPEPTPTETPKAGG